MPRRQSNFTQADVARILRAHHQEGRKVRTCLRPDGSIDFEEIEPTVKPDPDDDLPKEIVL